VPALRGPFGIHGLSIQKLTVKTLDPEDDSHSVVESGEMTSLDQVLARAPLGRLGSPDDIGATVAFLCSDAAGYITGQQINVNGSWYL
jgi:NAD(P)-dependent dehydrogenase (short-subunit alcohol dehydrogenase family)